MVIGSSFTRAGDYYFQEHLSLDSGYYAMCNNISGASVKRILLLQLSGDVATAAIYFLVSLSQKYCHGACQERPERRKLSKRHATLVLVITELECLYTCRIRNKGLCKRLRPHGRSSDQQITEGKSIRY